MHRMISNKEKSLSDRVYLIGDRLSDHLSDPGRTGLAGEYRIKIRELSFKCMEQGTLPGSIDPLKGDQQNDPLLI
jgi:hypothetical protein